MVILIELHGNSTFITNSKGFLLKIVTLKRVKYPLTATLLISINFQFVAVFATMAAYAAAGIIGPHGSGAILTGPSGIITPHGPIGPDGYGAGYGHGLGLGYGLGHGSVISGPVSHAAIVSAPVAHTAVVAGPALGYGHGLGLGYGLGAGHLGLGYSLGAGHGLGHGIVTNGGGVIGLSGHGVAVKGPETVPAVISGPSGKIVADGLYGVPTHHGYHHGW